MKDKLSNVDKAKLKVTIMIILILFIVISCPIITVVYYKVYYGLGLSRLDAFMWYLKKFWWVILIYIAFGVWAVIDQRKK